MKGIVTVTPTHTHMHACMHTHTLWLKRQHTHSYTHWLKYHSPTHTHTHTHTLWLKKTHPTHTHILWLKCPPPPQHTLIHSDSNITHLPTHMYTPYPGMSYTPDSPPPPKKQQPPLLFSAKCLIAAMTRVTLPSLFKFVFAFFFYISCKDVFLFAVSLWQHHCTVSMTCTWILSALQFYRHHHHCYALAHTHIFTFTIQWTFSLDQWQTY